MIHRGYFVMLSVPAIDNWLCKCVCLNKFGNEVSKLSIGVSTVISSGYSAITVFSNHLPCLFLILFFFCLLLTNSNFSGESFLSVFTCKYGDEGHSLVAHVVFHVRGSTKWRSVHITLGDICLHEIGSHYSFPFLENLSYCFYQSCSIRINWASVVLFSLWCSLNSIWRELMDQCWSAEVALRKSFFELSCNV